MVRLVSLWLFLLALLHLPHLALHLLVVRFHLGVHLDVLL
jgi:hypothetical protein